MTMRETLDDFTGGIQIGGQEITNLRYADVIVLITPSGDKLQELVTSYDSVDKALLDIPHRIDEYTLSLQKYSATSSDPVLVEPKSASEAFILPPDVPEKWEVIGQSGDEGGQGEVAIIRDKTNVNRRAAIKVYKKDTKALTT
ncbi:unnamed protein product [Rotaria sp. Silwood1]|nr:unnamed protein product [Rotaria sp. Silwood1]